MKKILIMLFVSCFMLYFCGCSLIPSASSDDEETAGIADVENKSSGKIDESKGWVYDADYAQEHGDLIGTSYMTSTGMENIAFSDIVAPWINMDSVDADYCNDEIYSVYQEMVSYYENEYYSEDPMFYDKLNYEYYADDDLVSVLMTVTGGGTAPENYTYYTFNLNLKTLEKMNLDEVLTLETSVDSEDKLVEKALAEVQKEHGDVMSNVDYDRTAENLRAELNDGTLPFFVDESGTFCLIVHTFMGAVQNGEYDYIISIE